MSNKYWNETFRKAAQDAGITGTRGIRGDETPAIKDFSHYLHNLYEKWERDELGYHGIREEAEYWWSVNWQRYSGNTSRTDESYVDEPD